MPFRSVLGYPVDGQRNDLERILAEDSDYAGVREQVAELSASGEGGFMGAVS